MQIENTIDIDEHALAADECERLISDRLMRNAEIFDAVINLIESGNRDYDGAVGMPLGISYQANAETCEYETPCAEYRLIARMTKFDAYISVIDIGTRRILAIRHFNRAGTFDGFIVPGEWQQFILDTWHAVLDHRQREAAKRHAAKMAEYRMKIASAEEGGGLACDEYGALMRMIGAIE